MQAPRTFKGRRTLWISSYCRPEDLHDDDSAALSILMFGIDSKGLDGYTKVGEADVTYYLVGEDEMIANKVESLRAELAAKRAKAAEEFMELEDRISKLLAITHEVAP